MIKAALNPGRMHDATPEGPSPLLNAGKKKNPAVDLLWAFRHSGWGLSAGNKMLAGRASPFRVAPADEIPLQHQCATPCGAVISVFFFRTRVEEGESTASPGGGPQRGGVGWTHFWRAPSRRKSFQGGGDPPPPGAPNL